MTHPTPPTGPVPSAVLGRRPSAFLLAAQLLVLLAYPFLDSNEVGRAGIGVVQIGVVAAALAAVRRTPALTWVALLLGVPAAVFSVLEVLWASDATVLTSAVLHAPFYLYVSYSMIRYLFHDDKVTTDELYATAAAFTVVAWAFAYVYAAVQVLWPDSFAGAEGGEGGQTWFELLYLSFSVLTSVGLSDVVPIGSHARSFVALEMVVGVLYVALVISRLVGLTVSRQAVRAAEGE